MVLADDWEMSLSGKNIRPGECFSLDLYTLRDSEDRVANGNGSESLHFPETNDNPVSVSSTRSTTTVIKLIRHEEGLAVSVRDEENLLDDLLRVLSAYLTEKGPSMAACLDLEAICTRKNEAILHVTGGDGGPPITVNCLPYVSEDHYSPVLGSREMGADEGGLLQRGNPHQVLHCLAKQLGRSTLVRLSPISQFSRAMQANTPEIICAAAQYDCCKVICADNKDRTTTKYNLRFYKRCNPHYALGLVLPCGTESAVK